jgi:hypothetical protein
VSRRHARSCGPRSAACSHTRPISGWRWRIFFQKYASLRPTSSTRLRSCPGEAERSDLRQARGANQFLLNTISTPNAPAKHRNSALEWRACQWNLAGKRWITELVKVCAFHAIPCAEPGLGPRSPNGSARCAGQGTSKKMAKADRAARSSMLVPRRRSRPGLVRPGQRLLEALLPFRESRAKLGFLLLSDENRGLLGFVSQKA